MKKIAIMAAALLLGAGAARAAGGRLAALRRVNADAEAKIQAQVLDALLGRGKAYAFLELKAELLSTARSEAKSGTGEMSKSREEKKGDAGLQKQHSTQDKKESEAREDYTLVPREMKLRVLHDASLPEEKLKAVKDALTALYPGALKPEDVVFVPAAFAPAQ